MSFNKADIQSVKDLTFIDQTSPKAHLSSTAQPKIVDYIGAVHPYTEPAKQLLLSEHFNVTNHIDIFGSGQNLNV